jgi:hypothetical protein
MVYGEFKAALAAVLYVDTKIPADNAILIPMIAMELRTIAYLCKPLALVTRSPDFRIIRDLGVDKNGVHYYIRESGTIRDDLSKIDLDRELIDALLYRVAARISIRNEEKYLLEATKIISAFNFKMMEAEENADN